MGAQAVGFNAGDECLRRSHAGDDVGQSDVPARCYVARWPFAVPEVAACFDCAVAVDGSLETHVHPRRDRGEPCAPKAEFVPGLLGSRLGGGHINKAAVGGKARGSWARPDVRPFGLYSRSNAARQAGAAVLAFGDDPARERRRLATEPMRFGPPRPES
jgi:hypothetical protein